MKKNDENEVENNNDDDDSKDDNDEGIDGYSRHNWNRQRMNDTRMRIKWLSLG